MNKKSFVLLAAALTGVTTVAVGAVAVSGVNQMNQLTAGGPAPVVGTHTMTFDSNSFGLIEEDESSNYVMFELKSTTMHGTEYKFEADADGELTLGKNNEIIRFTDGDYGYFQATLHLKHLSSVPDVSITYGIGGDVDSTKSILIPDNPTDDEYDVVIYVDNYNVSAYTYHNISIEKNVVSYDCAM